MPQTAKHCQTEPHSGEIGEPSFQKAKISQALLQNKPMQNSQSRPQYPNGPHGHHGGIRQPFEMHTRVGTGFHNCLQACKLAQVGAVAESAAYSKTYTTIVHKVDFTLTCSKHNDALVEQGFVRFDILNQARAVNCRHNNTFSISCTRFYALAAACGQTIRLAFQISMQWWWCCGMHDQERRIHKHNEHLVPVLMYTTYVSRRNM